MTVTHEQRARMMKKTADHDLIARTTVGQIDITCSQLFVIGIDDPLAIVAHNTHRTDRTVKRQIGQR